jgi:DNA-binding transcriptional LysR family regulator
MDRLDAMAVLVAAVDAGSLSGASRRLGTPLATVSRKVSELEAHLRTSLLVRGSRRLTLTEAGQAYLQACRRILEEVGEAEREASGEYRAPKGELTIAAPIVFGRLHVLPVAAEFLAAYPEIDLRLTLADRMVGLVEEHIDGALRIGVLPDSGMTAIRLGTMRRVVCASPGYLAARGMPQRPEELRDHCCVTFEGPNSPFLWRFGRGGTETQIAVHSRLVVNTAEASVDAAIAGIGLTRLLDYQAAAAVAAGRLQLVLEDFEPEPWPVQLVHCGGRLIPLKLRAFLDFAAPRLRQRLVQPM